MLCFDAFIPLHWLLILAALGGSVVSELGLSDELLGFSDFVGLFGGS